MGRPVVAIVEADAATDPASQLFTALEISDFWGFLDQISALREKRDIKIIIKPELGGFEPGCPLATKPGLVEDLVDLLHDRGFTNVVIGSSADGAAPWAENRDVFALCDLLGYRFVTAKGRVYEVSDLAENLVEDVFPAGSTLRDAAIASAWVDADFRIVFAKCKTDEAEGYSLCLDSLVGILPEADKDLHYKRARSIDEVIRDVLCRCPVDFALIDATVGSHGGGQRAPKAIATNAIVASPSIVLADYACALKMGIDPFVSRTFQTASRTWPLSGYEIKGNLNVFEGWNNVAPIVQRSRRYRGDAIALDRLVEPWLQNLDADLFSLKNPLDATLNAALAPFFKDSAESPTANYILIAANLIIGSIGHLLESYRTLFDKDALRQKTVGLGFDPEAYGAEVFHQIVDDLEILGKVASTSPERSPGLRWRTVDKAIVFSYDRILDIDFDQFVERVNVARTIQFMNDYIGGVIVPLERDANDRPIRQAERNIYLPQPNYLILFHGKPIDVTKLECVEYSGDRHSLYWKTIHSSNGSAQYDDGIARFARTDDGRTSISIIGKQLFTLPLFWQVFDLDLVPDVKAALVTHAYQTFFDRTVANFEALTEGRDIRMGRPFEPPEKTEAGQLLGIFEQAAESLAPLMAKLGTAKALIPGAANPVDADGFVHGVAVHPSKPQGESSPAAGYSEAFSSFMTGLKEAAARDFAQAANSR
jgi:uncharacterized protein (DUF362 family)